MKYKKINDSIVFGFIILVSVAISLYMSSIYNEISAFVPKLESLMEFALPIYLAMLPVIIAAATFIYHIYYNRYSLKKYRRALKVEFAWLFVLLGMEMFLLSLFWVLKESDSFLFFESILVLFILLFKFFVFLKRFNRYSVGGFVQDYTSKCIEAIQSKKFDQKKVLKIMYEILQYFRESVERKESYYTEKIIESKSKIFCSYICQLNNLLLNGKLDQNGNEKLIDAFVDSVCGDYKAMNDNACSMKIFGLYSSEIADVLKTAIKCQNMPVFSRMIEEIQRCFGLIENEDLGFLNEIFEIAHEYARENNASEYAKKIEESSLKMLQVVAYKKSCSKVKVRLMISCQRFINLDIKTDIEVNDFIDEFFSRNEQEIKAYDRPEIECMFWVVSTVCDVVEKKRNKELFEFIFDKTCRFVQKSMLKKCDFAVHMFGMLLSKVTASNMISDDKKTDEKILNLFLYCVNYCSKEALWYFPDFKEKIEKNKTEQVCNEVKDAYLDIIQRLTISKVDGILYECFDKLNECIELFSQQERKCQEVLLSIYESGLVKSLKGENSDSFDIVMNRFDVVLKKLSNDGKISQGLLECIFKIFDDVGERVMETTDYSTQNYFVDYVKNLADVIPIINKDKLLKNRITEIIFHYIVSVLQYKNEKSLKICSNALGWFAVSKIDSGDFSGYEEVISYAVHMYELAYEQEFDKSTQVFLGTLFIIVGAYATARNEKKYASALNEKIGKMKNNNILQLSKRLRYYEAKCWDSHLGNDAKKYINDFFNGLKLQKNDNPS